jgi:hypothetical protein
VVVTEVSGVGVGSLGIGFSFGHGRCAVAVEVSPGRSTFGTRLYSSRAPSRKVRALVLRRLRSIFGGTAPEGPGEPAANLYGLDDAERERIGTPEDPLLGFEAAMELHEEAAQAEANGDTDRAITLYEESVAGGFFGSHPYERLASLHERRRNPAEALRVREAFIRLARSGKMPRGAQRSADRKLPDFEARAQRYRRPPNGA